MRKHSIHDRRWGMPLAALASALLVACGGGGTGDDGRSGPAAVRGGAVERQSDVVLFGLPDQGPGSVGTSQNPILVANLALGHDLNRRAVV